jgi:hypothetical protein
MNPVIHRNIRHIVSDIDIQLWAREQRRRWFARKFSAPLSKFARGDRTGDAAGDNPPVGERRHRVAPQRAGETIR